MATHTTKDKSTDVYGEKREEDTAAAAAVVVVAHPSTAERGPSRPSYGGADVPCVRALQGWVIIDVERLEGEVISLCGAGWLCDAINENWLAACRIKDQLPSRRNYNPLCCGLGSLGFI